MKPRIGVTPTPATHADDGRLVDEVNRAYSAAVVRAGGLPYILPVLADVDPCDLAALLEPLDGILLTGGGDVEPVRYGEVAAAEVAGVDPDRDSFELALVAAAAERGLPLLGICRGAQVLNVALGGTLVQHLTDGSRGPGGVPRNPRGPGGVPQNPRGPGGVPQNHRVAGRWGEVVHDVHIVDDSLLAGVVGTDRLGVNSLHHQAVATAGHGLRIVAWATDGIAEAIEGTDGWSVLGVQWHPELLAEFAAHAALFEWLVARSAVSLLAVADAA